MAIHIYFLLEQRLRRSPFATRGVSKYDDICPGVTKPGASAQLRSAERDCTPNPIITATRSKIPLPLVVKFALAVRTSKLPLNPTSTKKISLGRAMRGVNHQQRYRRRPIRCLSPCHLIKRTKIVKPIWKSWLTAGRSGSKNAHRHRLRKPPYGCICCSCKRPATAGNRSQITTRCAFFPRLPAFIFLFSSLNGLHGRGHKFCRSLAIIQPKNSHTTLKNTARWRSCHTQ